MFSAALSALPGRETSLGDSALLTGGRRNQDGEGEKRRRQEEIKMEKRGKQGGKGKREGSTTLRDTLLYILQWLYITLRFTSEM